MLRADEDAVICDLAETYGILHYKELSPNLVAVLCNGLRDDARIKVQLSGIQGTDRLLMAAAVDSLNFIAWTKTKNAEKGKNRPKSVMEALTGSGEKEIRGFESVEAYEAAREQIIRERYHGDRAG